MARKRGGLAGIWDRNKGIIKTAVPAALSFIPGVGVPLAAAAGAAMEGLDRPGKSGVGLDVGGAIRGGLKGYGIGKSTQAVAGGARALLAPRTPDISETLARTSGMLDEANAQILSRPAFGGAPTNFMQTVGGGIPATELEAMRQSARAAAGQMVDIQRPLIPTPSLTMSQAASPPPMVTSVSPNVASAARGVSPSMTGAARRVAPRMTSATGPVGPLAPSPAATLQTGFNRFPDLETVNRSIGAMPSSNPADVLRNKKGPFGRFSSNFGEQMKKASQFARENKDLIEMAGKGAMKMMPDQAAQMRAETDRMQADTMRRYYEFQMQQATEQRQQDEARRRAILQFLSPYIRQNAPLLNPSAFGMEG